MRKQFVALILTMILSVSMFATQAEVFRPQELPDHPQVHATYQVPVVDGVFIYQFNQEARIQTQAKARSSVIKEQSQNPIEPNGNGSELHPKAIPKQEDNLIHNT